MSLDHCHSWAQHAYGILICQTCGTVLMPYTKDMIRVLPAVGGVVYIPLVGRQVFKELDDRIEKSTKMGTEAVSLVKPV